MQQNQGQGQRGCGKRGAPVVWQKKVFGEALMLKACVWGVMLGAWALCAARVETGLERLFKEERYTLWVQGRRVGLITNQTGVDGKLKTAVEYFVENRKLFILKALFAPEHGIDGSSYAGEEVQGGKRLHGVPVYSLHGTTRRPTEEMLRGIDVLVFDIQDVGVRAYTYLTTLCYAMEEAAKRGISVVVLDRPNPLGGELIDGPMLHDKWRSFIGYLNVPYCHGMTFGELARLFNAEYRVGCDLKVVPMKGWRRSMTFAETLLPWVPPSPQVPEPDTPFYMASTGILGELGIVSIGIGYTLPFKVVGAPWIDGRLLAQKLSEQKMAGIAFSPFHFRPFFGAYAGKDCSGVRLLVTDPKKVAPIAVQYMLMGILKSLYPKEMENRLKALSGERRDLFCKANGNEEALDLLSKERYVAWKLIGFERKEREAFSLRRAPYLLYD